MPKSIKEIKDFNIGTVLNVSEKDIPAEAPTFSLNINPMAEGGILDAIYNNRIIATSSSSNLVYFEHPVMNGSDSGQSTGLGGNSYNVSNTVINTIKGLGNQAFCDMKITGTKGRQEKLLISNVEPWWELVKTTSGANLVAEHNLMITTSAALGEVDSILSYADIGKASTTVVVTDGDSTTHGMTNGEYIQIVSTDGTEKFYVICDDNTTTVATGDVLTTSSDIGADTLANLTSLTEGVAVTVDLTGTAINQNAFLVQLRIAILHANGHNGAITVSSVPGAANGIQSIKLTQTTAGADGNTPITENIGNVAVADDVFAGGLSFDEDFEVGEYLAFVGIEDSSVDIDATDGYAAGTTSSLTVTGSHANNVGRIFVKSDGTLIGTCTAVSVSTGITFGGGIVNALSDNDDLYMIKAFNGNVDFETFQVKSIDVNSKTFEVNRQCFGTKVNTLTTGSAPSGVYFIFGNRETINSGQHKTSKGTCLLGNWSTYSGNHIKGNPSYFIKADSTALREKAGKYALGSGGSDNQVTFNSTDKTMTLVNVATAPHFAEGDTINLYHSASNTSNSGSSFKVLKVVVDSGNTIFTLDTTPTVSSGTSETLTSGTLYIEADLIKNGTFFQFDITGEDSGSATKWKATHWVHRGYENIDSEENTYTNDYNDKTEATGVASTSQKVVRDSDGGGWWEDTNAGHGDVAADYYPFESNDAFMEIEAEYWGSGAIKPLTTIGDGDGDTLLNLHDSSRAIYAGGVVSKRISKGDVLLVESEYMKVIQVDGSKVNVERGLFGSTIATHATSTDVKKSLNMLIEQDVSKARLKAGQAYEISFVAKRDDTSAYTYGYLGVSINGGYFDVNGVWVENSGNYLNGLNSNNIPQNEQRWISLSDIMSGHAVSTQRSGGSNLEEFWQKFNYKFYVPRDIELSSDLKVQFMSSGIDATKVGIDLVSLSEHNVGVAMPFVREYISSAGILQDIKKRDLILYDKTYNKLKVIQDFKEQNNILTASSTASIEMSDYMTGQSISDDGNITMLNNNREMHVGFGSGAGDSSPQWLGYLNHAIFGNDETDTLYLDEDTVHSYDGTGDSGTSGVNVLSKVCLAGEHEYLKSYWNNSGGTITDNSVGAVDLTDNTLRIHHASHSMNTGDNIVLRQWADASNSWDGSGVWVVISGAEDDYFDCKRFNTLDKDPIEEGIIGTASTAWNGGSNMVTVTCDGNHNLTTGDNVLIYGATNDTDTNTTHSVTVTGATTYTFIHAASASIGNDTGVITVKEFRLCYRPYYYYGIKDGGYQIYRVWPDTRIEGSDNEPDTGDGTVALDDTGNYLKGKIEASLPLNYKISSITCCYNKATDGTGGGRVYVLAKGSNEVHIIDVQKKYNDWATSELTTRGSLSMNYRSFKWSNDISAAGNTPTGDINQNINSPVYDSQASTSTPTVNAAGLPSDIVETKGPEPTFVMKATTINENEPVDFGCRLWVQFHPGAGNYFTEGSRFLFCGLTNNTNTNAISTIQMGDRTPPTTICLPQKPRYRYAGTNPDDKDVTFPGGHGPSPSLGDRSQCNTGGMSSNTQKRYAYFENSWEINSTSGKLRGLAPVYSSSDGVGSTEDWFRGHPYRYYDSSSAADPAILGNHKIPNFHFGYNTGWDAYGGVKPQIRVAKYGLVAMADNDRDGVIDGTGLIVASAETLPTDQVGQDEINTGPYGHYHQRVCSHAVGLIGGCNRKWVRHWGRLFRWTKTLYEAGEGRPDRFGHHRDAPDHVKADKVLWVCSDIHFGDYTPGWRYAVSSVLKKTDYGGISGNHIMQINFSSGTKNLQAGDSFWMTNTGTGSASDANEVAGYIIEQVDADSFVTSIEWPSSGFANSDSTIGTMYIYPFAASGNNNDEWRSQKIDRAVMPIGSTSQRRLFHFAFDATDKDDGGVFTRNNYAPGHYAKKWWTPPACWGHIGDNSIAWSSTSPGILWNIERLNYRAGYMMRPFSIENDTFENLVIGDGTYIDMPCAPDATYHAQNSTFLHYTGDGGDSAHKNHYASRLFISSPDTTTGDTRMYVCDINAMYPDDSIQQQVYASNAGSAYNTTNEYNDDPAYDMYFGGLVYNYFTTIDATNTARSDAIQHPAVQVKHNSTTECKFNQDIVSKTYYKKDNHYAGFCISVMDPTTGAIETRYIVGSESTGTYHYLKVHYPFKTAPANGDYYWVWGHHSVCTASIRLFKQFSTLHGLGYVNNADPFTSGEIYRDASAISSTSSSGTIDIETSNKHNLSINDLIKIDGGNAYDGQHTVTVVNSPTNFTIAGTNTGSSSTIGAVYEHSALTGQTSGSNPFYLAGISSPVIKSTFGGLDLRKTKSYVTTDDDIQGSAVASELVVHSAGHLLNTGDMVTINGNTAAHDGVYIIKDGDNADDFDVANSSTANDTTDAQPITTNQWELLVASTSGQFLMGEMRSGINCWDKGNVAGNIIRYDKATADDEDTYMMPTTVSGVEISPGSIEDTTGYFQAGINYEYKISFIYDGYQEGLLTASIYNFVDPLDRARVSITLRIGEHSRRLTHVCLYRRDDSNDLFKLVKELKTDDSWSWEASNNCFSKLITDKGPLGATYESRTGLSQVLDNIKLKYGLSTAIDGYLFAGQCSHQKIENASNLVFRSKPGKFSVFDYANDTIQLKSAPTAMTNFMGRLYVFDEGNTYRINQESLVIEDTFEGIGCLSKDSVIVTEYGMFYADENGAYMHNGTTPQKISNAISQGGNISGPTTFGGSDNINDVSWDNTAGNSASMPPVVTFDSNIQSVLFLVEYLDSQTNSSGDITNIVTYYLWSYNIPKQRWDLWELDTDVKVGKPFVGDKGKAYIPIDSVIYELRGGSTKRDFTWISKKLNMEVDSVLKVFNKLKVNGVDTNLMLGGNNKESSDRLLVNTNIGSMVASDITYSADSTNNSSYKLSGTNRKGRWVQFKLEDIDEPIDSIGVIYRLRSVK